MIKDILLLNRSYRRFDENVPIAYSVLEELIDYTRFTASAANRQNLRYILVNQDSMNEKVFRSLGWAGYLKDWPGPVVGERPSAYIVVVSSHSSNYLYTDLGITAQTILLGAVEKGFGGCMFGSVDRDNLEKDLELPEDYEILLVIALGKPIEEVVIDPVEKGSLHYWRDEKEIHHVPKLDLSELILRTYCEEK